MILVRAARPVQAECADNSARKLWVPGAALTRRGLRRTFPSDESSAFVPDAMTVLLAGVPFVAIAHHDLRMFRTPGVYVFSRRRGSQRSLLQVGHADEV